MRKEEELLSCSMVSDRLCLGLTRQKSEIRQEEMYKKKIYRIMLDMLKTKWHVSL